MKTAIVSGEFPKLETERLVLRNVTLDDAEAIFAHFADEEVTRFLEIPRLESVEQAENVIMFMLGLFERREGIRWAISLKESDQLIGSCGFDRVTKLRGSRGEIKYDLMRDYWGHGIMAEALAEVIRFGFDIMKLNRIEALVVSDAARSMSLLCKMGFQNEGTLRGYTYWKGQFWDEVSFSLLKNDWEQMQKGSFKW